MDRDERGINPMAMTIINPRKRYWPSFGIEQATSCSQVLNATDRTSGDRRRVLKRPLLFFYIQYEVSNASSIHISYCALIIKGRSSQIPNIGCLKCQPMKRKYLWNAAGSRIHSCFSPNHECFFFSTDYNSPILIQTTDIEPFDLSNLLFVDPKPFSVS